MEGPENNTDIRILKSDYVREYVESDTYREAMRQTFATRARIGRVLGRFLLDHPWGQFLVKTQVFSDPILVEEQKHEQKVRALSEKIAETLPQVRSEDIELLTRMEPDFQPRTPEQVILETCIDQIARYQHRHYIFPNRHFRASLFQYMMTLLIVHGEARFERFDAFWQDAGLDMSDPAELQQLCREKFPYDHWYEVMNENTARYFGLLEILHSYGIRP